MQLRSALTAGEIDATVWNVDDFVSHPDANVGMLPTDGVGFPDLYDAYSEAVVVVKKGQTGLLHLLDATLVVADIRQVQEDVVNMTRLPSY
jgi:hypothetical protein